MSQQQIETSFNTSTSNNVGYNSAPSLKIRLDTSDLRENIEMYLKGEYIATVRDDTGRIFDVRQKTGNAKANDKGIHALLNFVTSIINPSVVQGNFPSDKEGQSLMFNTYIEEVNINLITMIEVNLYEWEIFEEEVEEICDTIMQLVIPYMTRLIDNKERESYDNTMKHIESNTVKEGDKKVFGIFG